MRYWTYLSVILLALPSMASASHCKPAFTSGDQSVTIDGVEIEAGGLAKRDFTVRVRNAERSLGGSTGLSSETSEGKAACPATIRVARFTPTPDPDFPPYTLSAPGNRQVEILPDLTTQGATNSDVQVASAASGPQARAVPFSVELRTEWGLPAGTYTEQLRFSLIDHQGEVADQTNVTITIVIPSAISLRLIGAIVGPGGSGPAQVDLGDLSATEETRSDRFGALILSTAPYSVSFKSENEGYLRHEQGSDSIAYRLQFDGRNVDLAAPNVFFYPQRTPTSGDRRSIEVVVPPAAAVAGRYTDRVSITATTM